MSRRTIEDLNDQQDVLQAVLLRLHAVAESASLRYCCAYGTALGAVRHRAPIPWDSDCDVVVPVDDLGPLVRALTAELEGSEITVHDVAVDSGYDHLFPRLSIVGIDHNSLHVDLFPLVGTFRRPSIALLHLRFAKLLRLAFLFKRTDPQDRYGHDPRKRRIARFARSVLSFVPDRVVVRAWQALTKIRPIDGERPVLSIGGPYGPKEIDELATFFPAGTGSLGGSEVALPRDVEGYLTRLYGDYMTPPSPGQVEAEERFFYRITLPKITRCLHGDCGHEAHRR